MEKLINKLEIYDVLKDKLPMYKDLFIKYYGIEYKDKIDEVFDDFILLPYMPNKEYLNTLDDIKEKYSKQLFNEILEDSDLSLDIKDLFYYKSFEDEISMPISNYEKLYEIISMSNDEKKEFFFNREYDQLNKYINVSKEEFFNMLGSNNYEFSPNVPAWLRDRITSFDLNREINRSLNRYFTNSKKIFDKLIPGVTLETINISDERINKLNDLVIKKNEAIIKYNNLKQTYAEFFEEGERRRNKFKILKDELYLKYIKENLYLIPGEIKEKFNTDYEKYNIIPHEVSQIIGSDFEFTGLIDSFSEESNVLLNDDNSWKKESIINDRIKYFKQFGIDLGDDYSDYLNDSRVQSIIPSKDSVEKYLSSKEKYKKIFDDEYYKSLKEYNKFVDIQNKNGLLDRDSGIDINLFKNGGVTCVATNVKKIDGKLIKAPILLIDASDLEIFDHNMVHELNHLLELTLTMATEKYYEMICGWDILNGTINNDSFKNDDIKVRKYELFNEVINETITKEILQNKSENIMDDEKSKSSGVTSYERFNPLIKDFYQLYKKDIIKSRCDGNIQIIYDSVGRDNFNNLNDLINTFDQTFNGMIVYKLFDDLVNSKDTDLTREYYDFITQKNKILGDMKKYHEKNKSNKQLEEMFDEERKEIEQNIINHSI